MYTSAATAFSQKGNERPNIRLNEIEKNLFPVISLKSFSSINTDRDAKKAERRLTLKYMFPIGIKVNNLPINAYNGEPAGWPIPRVYAISWNSGASLQYRVGDNVNKYEINVIKKTIKNYSVTGNKLAEKVRYKEQ